MNLIDYNKAVEALEKERKYLLDRGRYGAENVLVHHALNVITELPVIRQPVIVRCENCLHYVANQNGAIGHCTKDISCWVFHKPEWFCADGKKRKNE